VFTAVEASTAAQMSARPARSRPARSDPSQPGPARTPRVPPTWPGVRSAGPRRRPPPAVTGPGRRRWRHRVPVQDRSADRRTSRRSGLFSQFSTAHRQGAGGAVPCHGCWHPGRPAVPGFPARIEHRCADRIWHRHPLTRIPESFVRGGVPGAHAPAQRADPTTPGPANCQVPSSPRSNRNSVSVVETGVSPMSTSEQAAHHRRVVLRSTRATRSAGQQAVRDGPDRWPLGPPAAGFPRQIQEERSGRGGTDLTDAGDGDALSRAGCHPWVVRRSGKDQLGGRSAWRATLRTVDGVTDVAGSR